MVILPDSTSTRKIFDRITPISSSIWGNTGSPNVECGRSTHRVGWFYWRTRRTIAVRTWTAESKNCWRSTSLYRFPFKKRLSLRKVSREYTLRIQSGTRSFRCQQFPVLRPVCRKRTVHASYRVIQNYRRHSQPIKSFYHVENDCYNVDGYEIDLVACCCSCRFQMTIMLSCEHLI